MKKSIIILVILINSTITYAQQWDGVNTSSSDIKRSGNVGIGIIPSNILKNYKLAVGGALIAEEVRVELKDTWPDYVFEKKYNLPTLKHVENYITKNGHLENIPSAKEVLQNGIKLGEMNALLLEKIEELTLYIIQQEKRIEKLEKEYTNN